MPKKAVSFRLDNETIQSLDEMTAKTGRTKTFLLSFSVHLLENYWADNKKMLKKWSEGEQNNVIHKNRCITNKEGWIK